MKTKVGFAMGALATLVLATAAYADVQDRVCFSPKYHVSWGQHRQGMFGVRSGMPCRVVLMVGPDGGFIGPYATISSAEIIHPPQNLKAVPRADGNIYVWPQPGFTGKDSMIVRYTGTGRGTIGRTREGFVTFSIDVF